MSGFPHGRSDGKMLPFPAGWCRCEAAVLITASICCAFSRPFSFFPTSFYCELLPLLCVIFPIHTQAISMSHTKCSVLQSRPKVFLQTDSLFMVFSSINGLLSPDTMGFCVGHILIFVSKRITAVNIIVCRHLLYEITFSRSNPKVNSRDRVASRDRKYSRTVLQYSLEVLQFLLWELLGNAVLFTPLYLSDSWSYWLYCHGGPPSHIGHPLRDDLELWRPV